MNFKNNKGFTLIELLVVIAIIGILSSVVLASLNTARDKGRDAAVKSTMQTIRVQSELYYDTGSTYGASVDCDDVGSMFADGTIIDAILQIDGVVGAANSFCGSAAQSWAVSVTLPTGTNWCTDSTGVAKVAITANGGLSCP